MGWTVRALFDQASEVSSAQLESCFLEAKANGCPEEVVEEVRSLIASAGSAGDLSAIGLERVRASAERTVLLGAITQIGPYRIRRVLARGGFGVVYLAEQEHPVRRPVAIKVLDPGCATPAALRHFEIEREVLGQLQHPNVASLLDAGTTEWGQAYIVMELVAVRRDQDVQPADPITQYCDQRRLPIRDRLELFRQVCHAVQHAHALGIIHRDLKPSNILVAEVEGKAVPKVIDFGIAKLTRARDGSLAADVTREGQAIGSLAYMSPEQASGDKAVSVQSDVYSLGVVLYELLVGLRPLDLRGQTTQQFLASIASEESPAAGRRLDECVSSAEGELAAHKIAEVRALDLRELQRALKRELEWIPRKAMRVDVAARYSTVVELDEDVRRYLAGEALLAGPESVTYRTGKMLKRHRVAATSTAVGIAAAVIALGAWRAGVASRRLELEHLRLETYSKDMEAAELRGNMPLLVRAIDEAMPLDGADAVDLKRRRLPALLALNRQDEARKDVEELLSRADLGPNRASVLIWAGDMRLLGVHPGDDTAQAAALIQEGLDLADRDATQRLSPADIQYAQGLLATDLRTAEEKYLAALALSRFHPQAGRMALVTSVLNARFQQALDLAIRQEALFPDDPEVLAWKMIALDSLGRTDEAAEVLRSLTARLDVATIKALQSTLDALHELRSFSVDFTNLGGPSVADLIKRVAMVADATGTVLRFKNGQVRAQPCMPSLLASIPKLLMDVSVAGGAVSEENWQTIERVMGPTGTSLASLSRAVQAIADRKLPEAEALLDRTSEATSFIDIRPAVAQSRVFLAGSQWLANPGDASRKYATRAIRDAIRYPVPANAAWTWKAYADLARNVGEQDLARYVWSLLLKKFPKNVGFSEGFAQLELDLDNPMRAIAICDEALKGRPKGDTLAALRAKAAERLRRQASSLLPESVPAP